jgi:hypothetical protein
MCPIRMYLMSDLKRTPKVKPRNPLVGLMMSRGGHGSHSTIKKPSRQRLKMDLKRDLRSL